MSKGKPIGALSSFGRVPAWLHLPPFDMKGRTVLDVGCGNGKDLTHPVYAEALARWGIDPDERGIEAGRKTFEGLTLVHGMAESLPFPDAHFDVVTSRVALPYMNIPVALREMARVMKPDGYLCVTLHDWKLHRRFAGEAWQERQVKPILDLAYVMGASLCYALTGWIPPRPWNGTRETFQFVGHMRRQLARRGFVRIAYERTERSCFLTARKLSLSPVRAEASVRAARIAAARRLR